MLSIFSILTNMYQIIIERKTRTSYGATEVNALNMKLSKKILCLKQMKKSNQRHFRHLLDKDCEYVK